MKKTILLFFTLFLIVYVGCKKKGEEEHLRKKVDVPSPVKVYKEDFAGLFGYGLTHDGLVLVSLKDNKPLIKIFLALGMKEVVKNEKHLYAISSNERRLFYVDFRKGEKVKEISLNGTPVHIIKDPKDGLYILLKDGRILKIDEDGKQSEVISVTQDLELEVLEKGLISPRGDKIYALTKFKNRNLLKVVDIQKKKVERETICDEVADFLLTPFGERIYLLLKNRVISLDSKNLEKIAEISLSGVCRKFVSNPGGEKIYCLQTRPTAISVIDRAQNRVMYELLTQGIPEDIVFSRNGTHAYIIQRTIDALIFLDATVDSAYGTIGLPHEPRRIFLSPKETTLWIIDKNISVVNVARKEITDSITISASISNFILCERDTITIQSSYIDTTAKKPDTLRVLPHKTEIECYTIQVSSCKDRTIAEKVASKILSLGYPSYIFTLPESDWNRVRVGAFKNSKDAEMISGKIDRNLNTSSWILKATISPSTLPRIPSAGRDVNGDGCPEEIVRQGNKILLYTIKDGVYSKLWETSGERKVYRSTSVFYDTDKDGTEEILTPVEGGEYSIVSWDGKNFREIFSTR